MRNVHVLAIGMAAVLSACAMDGDGVTMQAVAGPGGVTVTVRAEGQLAVNWTPDAAAVKYYVFRSTGGVPAFIASVLDSSGGAPSTSYIDTGLTGGTSYCYAIESGYADGSTSDHGAAGCATAAGDGAASAMRTKVIAPSPDGVHPYVTIDVAQGVGHETVNLDGYFNVGDRIRSVRVHATDNPQHGGAVGGPGPTELQATLRAFSPSTGAAPIILAQSGFTDGSGHEQTLSIPGLDAAITAGGITHSVQVLPSLGDAPTVVWSVEVDYIAAP